MRLVEQIGVLEDHRMSLVTLAIVPNHRGKTRNPSPKAPVCYGNRTLLIILTTISMHNGIISL